MYVTETWADLERLFVNTGQMQLKRAFVEIWHEGYGALFVTETPKALPAPLSLHSLAVVMNTLPDFQKWIPLKVQNEQLLKDILIVINAPIPATNFEVSPKPVTCLLNYGKWVERGVRFLRSDSLTKAPWPIGRVSIRLILEHIGVIFSITPNLPFYFLSLAWTLAFRLNSFF